MGGEPFSSVEGVRFRGLPAVRRLEEGAFSAWEGVSSGALPSESLGAAPVPRGSDAAFAAEGARSSVEGARSDPGTSGGVGSPRAFPED